MGWHSVHHPQIQDPGIQYERRFFLHLVYTNHISSLEATHIFDGPILTKIDDREDYGEVREISMGMLSPDAVLVVVHTDRDEKTRLISARKANCRERQVFYDYLTTTFE